ncbi:unnamed protein product [Parnassius apollo]|uniref:(apollo) hypothetical protein n=1 Tax=Parnassius apollo TaxID=110799 RepID=A0A8S3WUV1_PARAO|nr:unnamed protein product [Parnassius apollo]
MQRIPEPGSSDVTKLAHMSLFTKGFENEAESNADSQPLQISLTLSLRAMNDDCFQYLSLYVWVIKANIAEDKEATVFRSTQRSFPRVSKATFLA